MKATGLVQAVIILLLLALAASCEVAREYNNRVFKSQPPPNEKKHSVRFMESDSTTASVDKEFVIKGKIEATDTLKTKEVIKEPVIETRPQTSAGTRTKKVRQ
jgi:hypothetical protein